MSGANGVACSDEEFVAGCNRYGLDNPTPTITRRLASYGNEEGVEKLIERAAKQYNDEKFLDPEVFGSTVPDKSKLQAGYEIATTQTKGADKFRLRDMEETKAEKRTSKRICGVADIRMLDQLENTKKFESPANIVLARGISIKIKDIPKNTTLKGKAVAQGRETNYEATMQGDSAVVVPSFGATGALFARHHDILRNLKRRIHLLKQTYEH